MPGVCGGNREVITIIIELARTGGGGDVGIDKIHPHPNVRRGSRPIRIDDHSPYGRLAPKSNLGQIVQVVVTGGNSCRRQFGPKGKARINGFRSTSSTCGRINNTRHSSIDVEGTDGPGGIDITIGASVHSINNGSGARNRG